MFSFYCLLQAAPVVAGVLAAVCVAALLAIGVMVIIRRNNDTPTQNKPVINSTAHTSSARLVDRTEPSSITGGGVVLDSNNKRVLVLEEDDQFQTTIRTMSDGASSSEYTPVDSNEVVQTLIFLPL